jgi:NAD(P)-dependent dehydrogenase (short-subunit alcohol dehydrogenase family)
MSDLAGKVALITGAGSGIGRAVAMRYIEEGAKVVAFDANEEYLTSLRKECGDHLLTIHGSVTELQAQKNAVSETVKHYGKLDILVANAGVFDKRVSIKDMDEDQLELVYNKLFEINVKGYIYSVKAALPALTASKGCIIMTCSVSSFHAGFGGTMYVAAKHAIAGLVRQLALELAPDIRVNGVAPGKVITNLQSVVESENAAPSIISSVDKRLPLYNVPQPEDLAGAYVYLASKRDAGHVTGTISVVDSGISIRGF